MYMHIKQTGPTCGIYAYLNGMFTINEIKGATKKQTDDFVYELLVNCPSNSEGKRLTFIGEFFEYSKFEGFLLYSNDVFRKHFNIKNTEFDVRVSNIENLEDPKFIEEIQENKAFALLSLNTNINRRKTNTISHWVAILGYDNKKSKYIISNSNRGKIKRYTLRKLKVKNKYLFQKNFYWKYYKGRKFFAFSNIDKFIKKQLKQKKDLLNKEILDKEVTHISGKMIIVRKVE